MLVFLAPFSPFLSHVKSFERFFRWSCGRQLLHHHYWLLYGILCARRHTYYLLFSGTHFLLHFFPTLNSFSLGNCFKEIFNLISGSFLFCLCSAPNCLSLFPTMVGIIWWAKFPGGSIFLALSLERS